MEQVVSLVMVCRRSIVAEGVVWLPTAASNRETADVAVKAPGSPVRVVRGVSSRGPLAPAPAHSQAVCQPVPPSAVLRGSALITKTV